jgi:hypothetical protein
MRPLLPCILCLALGACLPDLDEQDSQPPPEGDADTDADADTDIVLVDEEGLLPGGGEYADFTFDVEAKHLDSWIHIDLSSADATAMVAVLLAPWGSCNLEVPTWGWAKDTHSNEGWIRPQTRGRYTLSVFGTTPEGGSTVHTTIRVISDAELPFGDADEPCTSGEKACECTDRCNCRSIHD